MPEVVISPINGGDVPSSEQAPSEVATGVSRRNTIRLGIVSDLHCRLSSDPNDSYL